MPEYAPISDRAVHLAPILARVHFYPGVRIESYPIAQLFDNS